MIDVLPDMSEGVFGIRVSGRVRGDDLREFGPTMDELLQWMIPGELKVFGLGELDAAKEWAAG